MLARQVFTGIAISLGVASVGAVLTPDHEKPQGKMAITDKPLTVTIEPTDELRAGLAAAMKSPPKASIRLSIDRVVPPPPSQLIEGISVFVDKPDATGNTSAKDPHFIAAFTFTPAEGRGPENINLDLTRTLVGLSRQAMLDFAKPLKITLVATPAKGAKELPKGFSVPVGKVSLTVVNLAK